jgi:hypothetical protein
MKKLLPTVAFLALLASGCAKTHQGYPGPVVPESDVATGTRLTGADPKK